MRVLSRGCGIDAGGRTLTWVDDVRPADSLRVLSSLVTAPEGERDKRSESALMAIAVHEGPAADDVLERWLDPAQPVRIRKQTAFWMGNLRGRRGYEALVRVLGSDPSGEVREHAVFALTQSDVPKAVDAIIRVAQTTGARTCAARRCSGSDSPAMRAPSPSSRTCWRGRDEGGERGSQERRGRPGPPSPLHARGYSSSP